MNDTTPKKDQWLNIRLSEVEKSRLLSLQKGSTERKLSSYARKVLLQKPVVLTYRNKTIDEGLQVLIRLQKDLNGVANNYNQMIHKLHMLEQIPEFRIWVTIYEKEKEKLFSAITDMRDQMKKITGKWLL